MALTVLQDLANIERKKFQEVFLTNMDTIFSYSALDVQDIISEVDIETLSDLRKSLCQKAQDTFTALKDRRPVNRLVKHRFVSDIFHIGYSIVNGSPVKEIEKIFSRKEPGRGDNNPSDTLTDISDASVQELAELIKTVATVHIKLEKMECDLANVLAENKQLRAQIVELCEVLKVKPNMDVKQPSRPVIDLNISDTENESE